MIKMTAVLYCLGKNNKKKDRYNLNQMFLNLSWLNPQLQNLWIG